MVVVRVVTFCVSKLQELRRVCGCVYVRERSVSELIDESTSRSGSCRRRRNLMRIP